MTNLPIKSISPSSISRHTFRKVTLTRFCMIQSNLTYSIDFNKYSKSNSENKEIYFATKHTKFPATRSTRFIHEKHRENREKFRCDF